MVDTGHGVQSYESIATESYQQKLVYLRRKPHITGTSYQRLTRVSDDLLFVRTMLTCEYWCLTNTMKLKSKYASVTISSA